MRASSVGAKFRLREKIFGLQLSIGAKFQHPAYYGSSDTSTEFSNLQHSMGASSVFPAFYGRKFLGFSFLWEPIFSLQLSTGANFQSLAFYGSNFQSPAFYGKKKFLVFSLLWEHLVFSISDR
ncbi:hypothetical protein V6N13_088900 [Hibiscus sabdariffa]